MKIVWRNDFYHQYRKMIVPYKKSGYNTNVMPQIEYFVVNSIRLGLQTSPEAELNSA